MYCLETIQIPPNIYANVDSTPASLFERFLDDVVGMLVEATNLYAKQEGNHTFTTSPDKFRLFVAVLFTSGYNPLPRRKLYWENTDDVVNIYNTIYHATVSTDFDLNDL